MTNTEARKVLAEMLMYFEHSLTDDQLEAIAMAGKALEDDWISVEDRLPKEGMWVLTYRPDVIEGETINTEHFMGGDLWGGDAVYRGPVTHWRRLPKGPEERKK